MSTMARAGAGKVFDIVIVGDGAAAVALLDALDSMAAQSGRSASIALVGSAATLGHGQCYREDSPALLMNSPAADMSISSSDKQHFVKWLDACGFDRKGEFVPRYVFGRYLRAHAQALLAKQVLEVERFEGLALDIRRNGVGFEVTTSGATLSSRKVALATGVSAPDDHYGLAGSVGYFPAAFPINPVIDRIGPDQDVFIVGSSLSAIDVAIALHHSGFRGNMAFISRRGRLPWIKSKRAPVTLLHVDGPGLIARAGRHGIGMRDVLRAARQDFATIGFDWRLLFAPGSPDTSEGLVSKLRKAGESSPWLNMLNAMQSELDPVWPSLRTEQRQTFIQRFLPDLLHKLASVPAQNLERVSSMLQSGQLRNLHGLKGLTSVGGKFIAQFADGSTASADAVINATGPSPQASGPLFAAIVGRKLAVPEPAGGLVCCPRSGALTSGANETVEGLHVLGHPSCGTNPIINNVVSIVGKARSVAEQLFLAGSDRTAPEARSQELAEPACHALRAVAVHCAEYPSLKV